MEETRTKIYLTNGNSQEVLLFIIQANANYVTGD